MNALELIWIFIFVEAIIGLWWHLGKPIRKLDTFGNYLFHRLLKLGTNLGQGEDK